ncbi:MAG: hypothetical protein RLZZ210_905, partial [Pseudomonadota bacterium]
IFNKDIKDITLNELIISLTMMQNANDNINHEILFSILKVDPSVSEKIWGTWGVICIRLGDLYSNNNRYYALEYTTSIQKLKLILFEITCISLDNLHLNFQKLINSKKSHYAFLDYDKY